MTNSKQVFTDYEVKSDVKALAVAILDVMEIAQSYGVQCWLNYGALLGMVRENRLLPWNNDAELTCWHDPNIAKKFRSITDALNEKGYHTYFYSTMGAIGVKKKGVVVNINCSWREGKYTVRPHETPSSHEYAPLIARVLYWMATFLGAYPGGFVGNTFRPLSKNEFIKIMLVSTLRVIPVALRKRFFLMLILWSKKCGGQFQKTAIPAEYFDDLVMGDFYEGKVLMPENPEKLLRFIYGEEWNIPKADWSFYSDKNKPDTGIIFIDEMMDYDQIEIV